MDKSINGLKKRIQSLGFRGFDAFIVSCLLNAATNEYQAASLQFKLRSNLNPKGFSNRVASMNYDVAKSYEAYTKHVFDTLREISDKHVAKLWKVDSLRKVATLKEKGIIVSSLAVDSRNTIYAGFSNGVFKIWKSLNSTHLEGIDQDLGVSEASAVTPDSVKYRLYQTIEFEGVKHPIRSISLSNDLLSIYLSYNMETIVLTMKRGRGGNNRKKALYGESRRFKDHNGPINAIVQHGRSLVTASHDGYVLLYSLISGQVIHSFNANYPVFCMTSLTIAGDDLSSPENVSTIVSRNHMKSGNIPDSDEGIHMIDIVAIGTANGMLKLLPLPLVNANLTGSMSKVSETTWEGSSILTGNTSGVSAVKYAWKYLYTGFVDGSVRIWSIQLSNDIQHDKSVFSSLFSNTKQFSLSKLINVVKVDSQSVHSGPVTAMMWTGGYLFTSSHDFSIVPWKQPNKLTAKNEQEFIQEITSGYVIHSDAIISMACNSHLIVSGDDSGCIHVSAPTALGEFADNCDTY